MTVNILSASLGPKASPKKIYQKPCLSIYGSVEKITQSVGRGARGDNGVARNNRSTGG
jgi:hypothetical protein